jgi:hypothetical protein
MYIVVDRQRFDADRIRIQLPIFYADPDPGPILNLGHVNTLQLQM